jgi:predicted acyltransferase
MIIVNTPGSGATPFAPFEHAAWHGFTPTDLVFPSFLFAVGNAMSFSSEKLQAMTNSAFLMKVLRRTLLIFALGFLMYWFPFFIVRDGHMSMRPFSETRVMGVLQRIALCYFFASLFVRYFNYRTVVAISCVLLVGYWILLLSFPGTPNDPFAMLTNTGSYIDMHIFGEKHMYHGEGVAFEPEGLLSTIPAIVNVVVGYYAGMFIRKNGKNYETISKLFLTGGAFILVALAWNAWFPLNKKLWTSPFVLLTTGIDLMLIGGLIYMVELREQTEHRWTRFFTIFGKNPLFIYLLSELLVIILYMAEVGNGQSLFEAINAAVFQRAVPGPVGSLLFAITYMLLCWSVGWWLDRKKIYVRV